MLNFKSCIAAAALTLVAGTASAATTNYDESDSNPSTAPAGAIDRDDFKNSPLQTIDVVGDTGIFGYVRHDGSGNQWDDPFRVNFGPGSFLAVFSFQNLLNTALDIEISYGDESKDFSVGGGGSGSASLGILSGLVDFNVNPIAGENEFDERATWDLQLSQVPVPAGGLLLLGGLGALAFARRKKA